MENLIANIPLPHTTPPNVNERLPTCQENGILEAKPVVGPQEENFAPNTYSNCVSAHLGDWK